MCDPQINAYTVVEKEMRHKGGQRQIHDASTIAAVGKRLILG